MEIIANDQGLYEFDIEVIGLNGTKKQLKGLIDTGSTDCVCTYKIITTLRTRPTGWEKVGTIDKPNYRTFVYSILIEFDGVNETFPVFRVSDLPDKIDMILGMSVLSKCNLEITENKLSLEWR